MRIGLDFDNTLAQYDHVFAVEAKRGKLIPAQWEGTKKQLRDILPMTSPEGYRSEECF